MELQGRGESDLSLSVPFTFLHESVTFSDPVGVVCHIFNIDLADEICSALKQAPTNVKADVFISTDTYEKAVILKKLFADWKNGAVEIRIAPNRGRDIAPKYITFRDVYDRYPLILFVHSKKTANLPTAADWRKLLIRTLTGSPEIVSSILWMFKNDEKLGVIFPQHYASIRPFVNWGGLFPQAHRLARQMGIKLEPKQYIDFPSGSMFWARSVALRPILDLGLTVEHFPEEEGQTNGTIAHVMERLVLHACEKSGYRWLKISKSGQCDARTPVISINSPDEFDALVSDHTVELLASARRARR